MFLYHPNFLVYWHSDKQTYYVYNILTKMYLTQAENCVIMLECCGSELVKMLGLCTYM